MMATLLVDDIKERDVGQAKPPSFPQPQAGTTGYPQPKKRTSAFRQQRQGLPPQASALKQTSGESRATSSQPDMTPRIKSSPAQNDKQRIDQENRDLLANMSPEEIAEEQRELLSRLDPKIAQMLLRRANIDRADPVFDAQSQTAHTPAPEITVEAPPAQPPIQSQPSLQLIEDPPSPPLQPQLTTNDNHDDLHPLPNTTHFPPAPTLPDLDPSSPDFLHTLHTKYFPLLPSDPSKLAWMSPLPTPNSPADHDSPYHPSQPTIALSALRFDFRARLITPSRSRQIPVTKGLHHHGEAPEAAGYTIPELARLARSAVPAQRCVAFQLLGRILYRLGRGEWGVPPEGRVAVGVWELCREGRVLESLEEAAGVPEGSGHRGSKAYATEALWLFEKGGWKERLRAMAAV